MSTKSRWYRLRLPKMEHDLVRALSRRPLLDSTDYGFYRYDSDSSGVAFRFLCRAKVVATQYDEDGELTFQEYQSLKMLNFSLVTVGRSILARIDNPWRNLSAFMNALEGVVGFGFSCSPITFEKYKPQKFLSKVDTYKLVSLKVSGTILRENLVARMEFASKMGMDVDKMKVLKGLHYGVDVSIFECVYRDLKGQISIHSNGTIRFVGSLSSRLRELVEKELAVVIESEL